MCLPAAWLERKWGWRFFHISGKAQKVFLVLKLNLHNSVCLLEILSYFYLLEKASSARGMIQNICLRLETGGFSSNSMKKMIVIFLIWERIIEIPSCDSSVKLNSQNSITKGSMKYIFVSWWRNWIIPLLPPPSRVINLFQSHDLTAMRKIGFRLSIIRLSILNKIIIRI